MTDCQTLAQKIEQLEPNADTTQIARLCLLLSNASDCVDDLADPDTVAAAWREMSLRLQAATDQHAAMTAELEELAQSDPSKFSNEQIWVLIRAIKVQSQILELYLGEPALDI
ncbi:MAG: hypothetical protein P8N76_18460 [Pirellulaceae bacterium]|nr:hypothetical protein [Pirellulaceae bacterium]